MKGTAGPGIAVAVHMGMDWGKAESTILETGDEVLGWRSRDELYWSGVPVLRWRGDMVVREERVRGRKRRKEGMHDDELEVSWKWLKVEHWALGPWG